MGTGPDGYRYLMDIDQGPPPDQHRHDLWREALSSVVLIGCVLFLLLITSALGRI
jgi:hypothetical protein